MGQQEALGVSADGVRVLTGMTRQESIAICRLGRLDSRRGATQLLEYRGLAIFIGNLVSLKDNSTLQLATWVRSGELRVFLDADLKDPAHVHCTTFLPSLGGNFGPRPDPRLIPDTLSP
jgi:hypothetical protein